MGQTPMTLTLACLALSAVGCATTNEFEGSPTQIVRGCADLSDANTEAYFFVIPLDHPEQCIVLGDGMRLQWVASLYDTPCGLVGFDLVTPGMPEDGTVFVGTLRQQAIATEGTVLVDFVSEIDIRSDFGEGRVYRIQGSRRLSTTQCLITPIGP